MGRRKQQTTQKSRASRRGAERAGTLVAIPVFNEYKYVDDLLHAVHEYSENILVVDDGSWDGTEEALKRCDFIQIITHKTNIGYGRSLIDAFRFAYDNKFNWVITIDCDYQHEPSYIPDFYAEIEKDDSDIISGSRYIRKISLSEATLPADRVAINKKITRILNQNLTFKLTDSFCGFKAHRAKAVFDLGLTEEGYALPLEMWIKASRAGLRVCEIPVPLIYHDPGRNFGGKLEDAEIRFDYYLGVIERELGYNVRKDAENIICS